MFKKDGNFALKSIKEARKILSRQTKKKEGLFSTPHPYLPLEVQFPILKGAVEISGEIQMVGQVKLEEKKDPDVKTKIKESEGYVPIDCYRQARIA